MFAAPQKAGEVGSLCLHEGGKLCRSGMKGPVVSNHDPRRWQRQQRYRGLSPSTPILPSPSLSPAARKALVSLSLSALAEAEKFCRNSLGGAKESQFKQTSAFLFSKCGAAHFSSSSSMKPLLSWSMMPKAFFTSSALLPARPHFLKKALYSKESAAGKTHPCVHNVSTICAILRHPHKTSKLAHENSPEQLSRAAFTSASLRIPPKAIFNPEEERRPEISKKSTWPCKPKSENVD